MIAQQHIKFRKLFFFAALAVIFCGLLFTGIAIFAPFIGLGRRDEFILYQHCNWSRRQVAHLGIDFVLVGAVLWLVASRPIAKYIQTLFGGFIRFFVKQVMSFLGMSVGSALKILVINLVIVSVLLLCIEGAVRLLVPESSIYQANQPGQYFRFQPYLQSSNEGPLDADGVWFDPLHNERIPFHVHSNNLGFRVDREFDTTTHYSKRPHERVVLIFGGSSVYGFGNTSNATTSSGYLQEYLNRQNKSGIHYTVFNMGNGGWVSYQELIAFNLYGLNLDPDWVIFCDGRNDIFTIPALVGDDVGFHFSTPMMRNYIDGYLYQQKKPDFFRGVFENDLLKVSAAYRLLSGKQSVSEHVSTRFPASRTWADVDRTVDFYLKTQRSVLHQCDHCQYILSTQPIYRSGRKKLSLPEREAMKEKYRDLIITGSFASDARFEDALMYADSRIIDEMPKVCAEAGARCHYLALDSAFPSNDQTKNKYFVDDVHLRNEGNALIARQFSQIILEAEQGDAPP